jgi:hypothetical protein
MRLHIALPNAVLLVGLVQAMPGELRGGEPAALEKKLVGSWIGGGCDGKLSLRADGTYELTDYGPAGDKSKGVWKVQWDALPPTLVLTCKESEIKEHVGQAIELEILKLNDQQLKVGYGGRNGSPPGEYTRAKKERQGSR